MEAAGIVDAVGEDVTDVDVGQLVFGPVDFVNTANAGASDYAILQHWTPVPNGLDALHAAALPIAASQCSPGAELDGEPSGHMRLRISGGGLAVRIADLFGPARAIDLLANQRLKT